MAEKLSFQEWAGTMPGKTISERLNNIAELLGVSIRTVEHWNYKSHNPRFAIANKLVRLSNGQLSIESIYESTQTINSMRA